MLYYNMCLGGKLSFLFLFFFMTLTMPNMRASSRGLSERLAQSMLSVLLSVQPCGGLGTNGHCRGTVDVCAQGRPTFRTSLLGREVSRGISGGRVEAARLPGHLPGRRTLAQASVVSCYPPGPKSHATSYCIPCHTMPRPSRHDIAPGHPRVLDSLTQSPSSRHWHCPRPPTRYGSQPVAGAARREWEGEGSDCPLEPAPMADRQAADRVDVWLVKETWYPFRDCAPRLPEQRSATHLTHQAETPTVGPVVRFDWGLTRSPCPCSPARECSARVMPISSIMIGEVDGDVHPAPTLPPTGAHQCPPVPTPPPPFVSRVRVSPPHVSVGTGGARAYASTVYACGPIDAGLLSWALYNRAAEPGMLC